VGERGAITQERRRRLQGRKLWGRGGRFCGAKNFTNNFVPCKKNAPLEETVGKGEVGFKNGISWVYAAANYSYNCSF